MTITIVWICWAFVNCKSEDSDHCVAFYFHDDCNYRVGTFVSFENWSSCNRNVFNIVLSTHSNVIRARETYLFDAWNDFHLEQHKKKCRIDNKSRFSVFIMNEVERSQLLYSTPNSEFFWPFFLIERNKSISKNTHTQCIVFWTRARDNIDYSVCKIQCSC